MQTIKQPEIIHNIISLLTLETDFFAKESQQIGYRERIKLERGLFLLLKCLCKNNLNYNIQGFSQIHREKLNRIIAKIDCDRAFLQTIDQIFQLKIFIKSLSSENAYVRGDALSRSGVNKENVIFLIRNQVQSITRKIILFH